MLGDPSVGKTSLIHRFVHDDFNDAYLSTIGAKVSEKDVMVKSEKGDALFHLVIWDIAGQQTFTSVSPSLFKGAQGALIVCDITRKGTLTSLNNWIFHLTENAGKVPFVVIVNKWDLLDQKTFELTEVETLVSGHDTVLLNTSAKTGHNVEIAFRVLAERLNR